MSMKTYSVRVVDLKKLADGNDFMASTQQVTSRSNNKKNARLAVVKNFPYPTYAVGLASER